MVANSEPCRICGHKHAYALNNRFRRIVQNPKAIVAEYVDAGDLVVDIGCGPGFFSIDMAQMVGPEGCVVAVDLQREMLEKTRIYAQVKGLEEHIMLHQCNQHELSLGAIQADFILCYYMVHETPDPLAFFRQVVPHLKPTGLLLMVEPAFHVGKKKFKAIELSAIAAGLEIVARPSKKGGPSLLLSKHIAPAQNVKIEE
jgi:ubiquinone/menaquinone biosynthesis C-methylase UbiE